MAYCENERVESLQFEYVISLKKKQFDLFPQNIK